MQRDLWMQKDSFILRINSVKHFILLAPRNDGLHRFITPLQRRVYTTQGHQSMAKMLSND